MQANLANLLTGSRLALAPVLLVLAWLGREPAFLVCLIISLLTDIVDGKVARWLGQASEFGTRLDSWADFATYLALPLCGYWLRPDFLVAEWPACVTVVLSFLVPVAIGFAKFRQLTSYHTRLARVAAYGIGGATLLMFAHGPAWPFRLAAGVLVLAALEEIAITVTLPQPCSSVPTLRHARARREKLHG